jgi:hypothetical protein
MVTGPVGYSDNTLDVGEIAYHAKLPLGLGLARELGYRLPNWVGTLATGSALMQGNEPPAWPDSMRSLTGVVGLATSAFSVYDEAKGVAQSVADLRRRARLGLSQSGAALKVGLSSASFSTQVLDVALPVAKMFGLITPSPAGAVIGSVGATIGVVRSAMDLARAARLAALVRVTDAKQRGLPVDDRLAVLDRFSAGVKSVIEAVAKGLSRKLADTSALDRRSLMQDAKTEIASILSDRVGKLAASKLLALASCYSTAMKNDVNHLEPDQADLLESLRAAYSGIDILKGILTGSRSADRDQRQVVGNLVNSVIASIRSDAELFRKRAIIKLCLSIGSLLLALVGLAAIAFPPAAPIVLLLQGCVGLCLSLVNLSTFRYEVALARRANLEKLNQRLAELEQRASESHMATPSKLAPASKKDRKKPRSSVNEVQQPENARPEVRKRRRKRV